MQLLTMMSVENMDINKVSLPLGKCLLTLPVFSLIMQEFGATGSVFWHFDFNVSDLRFRGLESTHPAGLQIGYNP